MAHSPKQLINFAIRLDNTDVYQEIKIAHYFWASSRSVMTMNMEWWIINIEVEPQYNGAYTSLKRVSQV